MNKLLATLSVIMILAISVNAQNVSKKSTENTVKKEVTVDKKIENKDLSVDQPKAMDAVKTAETKEIPATTEKEIFMDNEKAASKPVPAEGASIDPEKVKTETKEVKKTTETKVVSGKENIPTDAPTSKDVDVQKETVVTKEVKVTDGNKTVTKEVTKTKTTTTPATKAIKTVEDK